MMESALKTSVEEVSALTRRIQIEVPEPTVTAGLERAFARLKQSVRLRGFRQGKVPRPVLERLYGQQLRNEVIEDLVREAYGEAVRRHNIQPAASPDVVVEPLGEHGMLRFSATVEIYPEVAVTNYDGIEVSRPPVHVDPGDVDRVLERMQEAAAKIQPVVDRTEVQAGDIVTANITTTVDGKTIGEVPRRGLHIAAGSGPFPGALEERFVGLTMDSTTVLDVDYPEEYQNAAFAGKKAVFTVTVTGIGSKELPPLDDAFAQAHGGCGSLEELREKVRSDLERHAMREADAAVRNAVVDALIDRHPFDAPEALVERRCDALLSSLDIRMPAGADRNKTLATLRQELRPRAIREGKAAILLDRLAEQHGIEVGDDEVMERIGRIADDAGETRERARGRYGTDEHRQALRTQIMREKALSLVVDRSKIRTVEKQ